MTHIIDRRKALAVVAAVPAAGALGGVPATSAAAEFSDWIVLTLNTDLYEPEIPKGATVIFDPDLKPRDEGDFVMVELRW